MCLQTMLCLISMYLQAVLVAVLVDIHAVRIPCICRLYLLIMFLQAVLVISMNLQAAYPCVQAVLCLR